MNVLELFNRDGNKYIDLLQSVLLSEKSLSNDAEKEIRVEKNITTTINNKLEHAATFFQGLYLFNKFVPKISKDNLTKYFPHWISKLIQKLNNAHDKPEELKAVCKSIGVLLTSCKQEPDLDKKISLYHVKQLVAIIVELCDKKTHLSLLNLLTVLLYQYPESCGRLQASFGEMISSSLDSEDRQLVQTSAKCYALLIRANERQFINSYKESYVIAPDNSSASCHIYYQVNLCHYLHDIMDKVFQNFVTVTTELPSELHNAKDNNILHLPEISQEDIFDYYAANINRFANVCTFLSTLLRVGNSRKKFVLPNVILHVACRGLSITPANLHKSNESRKGLLLLILPKLYVSLLNLLETLITSFQQELVPFAFNIQKLILQTLEWTQTFNNEFFRDIRVQTYKLLSTWMRQARSLSGIQLVTDEVLIHMLKDISQSSDKVHILKANKTSKHNARTPENQKAKSDKAIDSSDRNQTDSVLCLQVLSTVECIVSNASCYLKHSFYDRIRRAVVLLLYDQYIKKTGIPLNKNSSNYRLQLLKTFRVLETFAEGSSTTSHAILIFELAASHERNSEIIAEARLGLAELRHIIYPTAPSLMLPLERTESALMEESSLVQTLRLEDLVSFKPSQQAEYSSSTGVEDLVPETLDQPILEKSYQKALEDKVDTLVESEQTQLSEDIEELVKTNGHLMSDKCLRRPLDDDKVDILLDSKRTKLSENTHESTCESSEENSNNCRKDKESVKDFNFCDVTNVPSPKASLDAKHIDIDEEEMSLTFCDTELVI